ncbi:hypothetical protein Rt10032_c18g6010 [Rhodotorula toruloides]|uniref:Protein kinase domain-containing protein n=1 Tax=Rhodotorula toruloides TaxID=5286 RepID=A0A511KNN8_RHOTO|nr:hypothetical protein Rt10032_c18g6008 [Rhodotorula toruloides]GEM11993.1 hypothetical protein Rt10032_c18g6010 [Rhodotorula toruloides]
MHPNSLASLLRTLALHSPVKDDFDPATMSNAKSELTATQILRRKDCAHRAIFVPSLVLKLSSSFTHFLESKASGDCSTAALPRDMLENIRKYATEFSAQPEDGYAENDFVFRRNGVFCVVLEAKNPTASLEGRLFRRMLEMFGVQTVRQLNAASKTRDSHVYSLLVKIIASCTTRGCREFIFLDYKYYIVGFLVPSDPPQAHPVDAIFSDIINVAEPDAPFAQVSTAMLYADKFFESDDEPDEAADDDEEDGSGKAEMDERRMGPRPSISISRSRLSRSYNIASIGLREGNAFRLVWPDATLAPYPSFHRIDNVLTGPSPPSKSKRTAPSSPPSPSSSSACVSSPTSPPFLRVSELVGEGSSSVVYRGYFPTSSSTAQSSFIVKIPHNMASTVARQQVLQDAGWLTSLTLRGVDYIPTVYGVFRAGTASEIAPAIIMVIEDGGAALGKWSELSSSERDKLYRNVLALHTQYGTLHGDLTTENLNPRNILVESGKTASTGNRRTRIIDFAQAEHHDCPGEAVCGELRLLRLGMSMA